MNIDTLKNELIADEGVKYEIYLDHLGYKTFGIGHLCRAKDPENDMEVGTEVSKERVDDIDIIIIRTWWYEIIREIKRCCKGEHEKMKKKIKKVIKGLTKASQSHAKQAKTLKGVLKKIKKK